MISTSNITEVMYEYIKQLDTAGVCYEALRQYFKTHGIKESSVPWENASAYTRASMMRMISDRDAVYTIVNDENITVEQAHNKRIIKRAEEGWVYGTEYDAEKQTDPNMCAYNELPIKMKVADALIGAIVKVLTDPNYKTE